MLSGVGEVNFFSSIITYITMFTSLGIPTYAIIEIAKIKNDKYLRAKTTAEILILNLLLCFVGYIIVAVLCVTVAEIKVNIPLFLLLSINILLVSIGCEWFYNGIEEFKYITIRGVALRTVCAILLFVLVRDSDDLLYYGLYCVLGVAGNNLINFFYLRKKIDLSLIKPKELAIRRHLGPSLQIFAGNVISSIYLQLDTVMLGFMAGNASVGYYTGAIRLTKMLMGITTSLGVVFLPRISSLLKEGDDNEVKEIISKTINFIIAVSLPIAAGLILLSPNLIRLFCGDRYLPAVSTLAILSPILVFISISYIFGQLCLAMGHIRKTIAVAAVCSVTNMTINFIMIPGFAQNGAAVGTLAAEFISMALYVVLIRKIFKETFIISRHSAQCAVGVVFMSAAAMLVARCGLSDIATILLAPFTGAIVYGLTLYFIGNKEFRTLYTSSVHRIKEKLLSS